MVNQREGIRYTEQVGIHFRFHEFAQKMSSIIPISVFILYILFPKRLCME